MAREPFNRIWAEDPTQFEEPDDTTWELGWEGGADKDPPQAKWENWWHNRVDEALRGIERQGFMQWHPDAVYADGGYARGSDGNLYRSQVDGNTGSDPVISNGGGQEWRFEPLGSKTLTEYGLGGATGVPPGNTLDVTDGSTPSGIYTVGTSTTGGAISASGNVMWFRRGKTGGEFQFLVYDENNRAFFRTRATGDWSAWFEYYHSGNLSPLLTSRNLSDLENVAFARDNLGLGAAATRGVTTFGDLVGGSTQITAGAGLQGGGNLSQDRTISINSGQRMTGDNVRRAYSGSQIGGVGTYAILTCTDTRVIKPGQDYSGGILKYRGFYSSSLGQKSSGGTPTTGYGTMSGTWRAMFHGEGSLYKIGLFLRVA